MSAEKRLVTCPTCKRKFDPQESRSMPFCSPRCRQIDLGRWLNEENMLPLELPSGEPEEEPPPSEPSDN